MVEQRKLTKAAIVLSQLENAAFHMREAGNAADDAALCDDAAEVIGMLLAALPSGAEPVGYRYRDNPDKPWSAEFWEYISPSKWAELRAKHRIFEPLYASPQSSSQVTEERIRAASEAVVAEWKVMVSELSPHMSAGELAKAFVSPGNHRLIRAALTAALSPVKGAGQ